MLEQHRFTPCLVLDIGQTHQITREVRTTEPTARIEIAEADTRVGAHALTHIFHIDTEGVGQTRHFVHVADTRREHAVDGQLGQFGGAARHDLEDIFTPVEGTQQLLHPQGGRFRFAAQQPTGRTLEGGQ